jgi:biopolymer transport protein TolQ
VEGNLSLWSLVANASVVVQLILLLLALASLLSWAAIIQRGVIIFRARTQVENFESEFWSGADLRQVYADGAEKLTAGGTLIGLEAIFRAGFKEFNRLRQKSPNDRDMVMEGVQRSMRIAITREQQDLEKHLPFLASVASVSPYIGLFGTVWGIMTSFRGLAAASQATLATVAPGISEALVATAMGLFAAIPAVLAYNRFAAQADSLTSSYSTFAEEFSSVLYRNFTSK